MPTPDFFQRLGLFTVERFLDADVCRRLRARLQSSDSRAGTVGLRGSAEHVVDPSVRSVRSVDVGEAMAAEVRDRLLNAQPAIEAFYNVALTDCEPLQFLAYAV